MEFPFQPGDVVILPADSRGIRLIKIVPDRLGPVGEMHWMRSGAELFTGEVPKCGYIFESNASEWADEQIDESVRSLPEPHTKTIAERDSSGSYEIAVFRIKCARCGYEREIHKPVGGQKTIEYREQWCSECERKTLHSSENIGRVDVKIPAATQPRWAVLPTWAQHERNKFSPKGWFKGVLMRITSYFKARN